MPRKKGRPGVRCFVFCQSHALSNFNPAAVAKLGSSGLPKPPPKRKRAGETLPDEDDDSGHGRKESASSVSKAEWQSVVELLYKTPAMPRDDSELLAFSRLSMVSAIQLGDTLAPQRPPKTAPIRGTQVSRQLSP